jgi:hypothetical protein
LVQRDRRREQNSRAGVDVQQEGWVNWCGVGGHDDGVELYLKVDMLVWNGEGSSEGVSDCCGEYHYFGGIDLAGDGAVDGNDERITEDVVSVRF